jgi:hypothetical protein
MSSLKYYTQMGQKRDVLLMIEEGEITVFI